MEKPALYFATIILLFSATGIADPDTCSYNTYKWSVEKRKAVDFRRVSHPYSELSEVEVDAQTGCTVCEEDQRTVRVAELPPIKMCRYFSLDVEYQLNRLASKGVSLFKLAGYRVGMTRGEIDTDGNRTQYSNHSFGIAIDINEEQNGLYDNCIEINRNCRLRKGGAWKPGQSGSLTADSDVVMALNKLGLKWGGKILGRQKDFMHFSPTGY